jgi:hypothetical protein
MRRRGKVGGKAAKTQRRKALKSQMGQKVLRRRKSSAADQELMVSRLIYVLKVVRERQTATSELL